MVHRKNLGCFAGLGLAALLGAGDVCAAEADVHSQPNIVLILADDLGWADLGCYGNRFHETPRLDRLAREAMRFTDYYAAGPVCSPTRASILSGQYQARFGLTAHIPGHWRPFEKLAEPPTALAMPLEIVTLAESLLSAGYATAHFGKWHLGGAGFGPQEQGFDTSFDFAGHTVPGSRQVPPSDQPVRTADYLAELAIRFMERHRDRPFFIQVSHFAVHIPLDTTPQLERKYEGKPKIDDFPCHPLYAGLVEELDHSTGRILDALAELDLSENTLVMVTSDNGGLEREAGGWPGTSNRPLRDEKGTLYEGGIRVPLLVRWPGVVEAESICRQPAVSTDLLPTLIEAAGAEPPHGQPQDGVSLLALLRGEEQALPREAIYWHYPHYHHSRPSSAVRAGDWKAIEFFDTREVELYNLGEDLGESRNLSSELPEKAGELRTLLDQWRRAVAAQMPERNPAYDPERAGEWWSRAEVAPTEAPGTLK